MPPEAPVMRAVLVGVLVIRDLLSSFVVASPRDRAVFVAPDSSRPFPADQHELVETACNLVDGCHAVTPRLCHCAGSSTCRSILPVICAASCLSSVRSTPGDHRSYSKNNTTRNLLTYLRFDEEYGDEFSAIAEESAPQGAELDRRWDAPMRCGGRRSVGVDVSRHARRVHGASDLPAPCGRCRGRQSPGRVLKRWRGMPRALICDASVCRGRPSLAAAPAGPDTRPRHSDKAASMRARSCSARDATRGMAGPDRGGTSRCSQRSSTAKVSLAHRMTARSMTFCSSRMFPGQS